MVFPMITETYVADQVKIGNYELGNALKSKFDDFEAFNSGRRPDDPFIKLHSGIYYHCDDVWNPEIGDIRVQFYYAGLQGSHVSIYIFFPMRLIYFVFLLVSVHCCGKV